jgi:predicted Zn-dependent protease
LPRSSDALLARAAVAVSAVLVLAWLGVMVRDERLLERAVEISGRVHRSADAARAEDSFLSARSLNPDTAPDVGRAVLYIGRGRRGRAVTLLDDVLRREPDNLTAWGLLFEVSRDADPRAARRALATRRRLDPFSARLPRAR